MIEKAPKTRGSSISSQHDIDVYSNALVGLGYAYTESGDLSRADQSLVDARAIAPMGAYSTAAKAVRASMHSNFGDLRSFELSNVQGALP